MHKQISQTALTVLENIVHGRPLRQGLPPRACNFGIGPILNGLFRKGYAAPHAVWVATDAGRDYVKRYES